jgi:hypothetical protein
MTFVEDAGVPLMTVESLMLGPEFDRSGGAVTDGTCRHLNVLTPRNLRYLLRL